MKTLATNSTPQQSAKHGIWITAVRPRFSTQRTLSCGFKDLIRAGTLAEKNTYMYEMYRLSALCLAAHAAGADRGFGEGGMSFRVTVTATNGLPLEKTHAFYTLMLLVCACACTRWNPRL